MTGTLVIPVRPDELLDEIERYLAAVALFRSEGCEPRWSSGESLAREALPDSLVIGSSSRASTSSATELDRRE